MDYYMWYQDTVNPDFNYLYGESTSATTVSIQLFEYLKGFKLIKKKDTS